MIEIRIVAIGSSAVVQADILEEKERLLFSRNTEGDVFVSGDKGLLRKAVKDAEGFLAELSTQLDS